MEKLLSLLTKKADQGFTLLELLLASVMTFFVVSATGYAILVMTRENIASDVSSDLRFNTDRAVGFITDEIKQATFLSTSAADIPTNTGTGIVSCAMGTGEQFVIGLAIASTDVNIVYYTKTPPESPWLGPSSIYRCGPPLSSTGQLNLASRTKSILVDSISVASTATTDNPTCASQGATKFPNSPNAGFFLCVDNTNQNLVELRITGGSDELADRGITTTGGQGRFDSKATYSVVTTAFTRAASGVATLTQSVGPCTSLTVAVDGRTAVAFSSGMSVIATRSSTIAGWIKTANSPSANQDTFVNGACTIIASF